MEQTGSRTSWWESLEQGRGSTVLSHAGSGRMRILGLWRMSVQELLLRIAGEVEQTGGLMGEWLLLARAGGRADVETSWTAFKFLQEWKAEKEEDRREPQVNVCQTQEKSLRRSTSTPFSVQKLEESCISRAAHSKFLLSISARIHPRMHHSFARDHRDSRCISPSQLPPPPTCAIEDKLDVRHPDTSDG